MYFSCLQFPMVVIATKADIKNERECDSVVIKKWAEAEKGTVAYFYLSFNNCPLNRGCLFITSLIEFPFVF